MAAGLPSASLLQNVRFNATVVVPNAAQGIFRRRRPAVAAATRTGVDGQAVGLLSGLAQSHDYSPVWVRVIKDPALLLLDPTDIGRALGESPDPFASDPQAKRDGMVAFQPDALTISRGELWQNRRRFTEAVLAAGAEAHPYGKRFRQVCEEESARLLEGPVAIAGGELAWEPLHEATQRIARRIILGDGAADDHALSTDLEELMSEANGMPGAPSEELPAFMERIEAHLARAEEGSLAAMFADAPCDAATVPAGQVPHWMFALGDTLAINLIRALVAIGSHPDAQAAARGAGAAEPGGYVEACLNEAMRLWPTTTMLSRVTLADTEWRGETVPAGAQILIVNSFGHRDPERVDYADRFAPEEWISGDAAANPAFNHFSRGPQGCPGSALALRAGAAVVAAILAAGELDAESPRLDPAKPLPHMLDFFGARVRIA